MVGVWQQRLGRIEMDEEGNQEIWFSSVQLVGCMSLSTADGILGSGCSGLWFKKKKMLYLLLFASSFSSWFLAFSISVSPQLRHFLFLPIVSVHLPINILQYYWVYFIFPALFGHFFPERCFSLMEIFSHLWILDIFFEIGLWSLMQFQDVGIEG